MVSNSTSWIANVRNRLGVVRVQDVAEAQAARVLLCVVHVLYLRAEHLPLGGRSDPGGAGLKAVLENDQPAAPGACLPIGFSERRSAGGPQEA